MLKQDRHPRYIPHPLKKITSFLKLHLGMIIMATLITRLKPMCKKAQRDDRSGLHKINLSVLNFSLFPGCARTSSS